MRRTIAAIFAFVTSASGGFAQAVSVGLLGGVPLTTAPGSNDESKRYVIGPSVEVRLPAEFAVEVDALYRRTGSSSAFYTQQDPSAPIRAYYYRQRGNSWEFPILGKYYFRSRTARWQPFLATGYAFHKTWQETEVSILSATPLRNSTGTGHSQSPLNVGATAAAGVRIRAGRLSVVPQFRYTRWGGAYDQTNPKNRVDFLLGIRF
jgi:hypothetical protein